VLKLPDQAPAAEQRNALTLLQESTVEPPALTVLGAAFSVTSGAGSFTVTVVDCVAEPPGPLQVNPKSVVLVNLPVDQVPLIRTGPLQPPMASQLVAFFVLQVRVEVPSVLIVVGAAARLMVGAA
jgi:hypothetical protein